MEHEDLSRLRGVSTDSSESLKEGLNIPLFWKSNFRIVGIHAPELNRWKIRQILTFEIVYYVFLIDLHNLLFCIRFIRGLLND